MTDCTTTPGLGGRRRRSGARWYGGFHGWKGNVGKVQLESPIREALRDGRRSLTLPEPVLRLAQAEYDRQFPGQPYERMQERGGLGLLEIVGLLADYIERVDPSSSGESGASS